MIALKKTRRCDGHGTFLQLHRMRFIWAPAFAGVTELQG
jgi:hypothetical protein